MNVGYLAKGISAIQKSIINLMERPSPTNHLV